VSRIGSAPGLRGAIVALTDAGALVPVHAPTCGGRWYCPWAVQPPDSKDTHQHRHRGGEPNRPHGTRHVGEHWETGQSGDVTWRSHKDRRAARAASPCVEGASLARICIGQSVPLSGLYRRSRAAQQLCHQGAALSGTRAASRMAWEACDARGHPSYPHCGARPAVLPVGTVQPHPTINPMTREGCLPRPRLMSLLARDAAMRTDAEKRRQYGGEGADAGRAATARSWLAA
jgi:hypothetical protein